MTWRDLKRKTIKCCLYGLLVVPALIVASIRKAAKWNHGGQARMPLASIRVFQCAHLGDLVLTAPFLTLLKQYYPEADITLVVGSWARALAKMIPAVDEVVVYDNPFYSKMVISLFAEILAGLRMMFWLRTHPVDLAIDVGGQMSSLYLTYGCKAKMTVGFNGGLLDKALPDRTRLYEVDRINQLLSLLGKDAIPVRVDLKFKRISSPPGGHEMVGIFPGAPWPPRRWPAQNYAALIDQLPLKLAGKKLKIIVLGGSEDELVIDEVLHSAAGGSAEKRICFDLSELLGVIARCRLIITNDSGPLHLAVTLGVPTVALFGPGDSIRWEVGITLCTRSFRRKSLVLRVSRTPFQHSADSAETDAWKKSLYRQWFLRSLNSGMMHREWASADFPISQLEDNSMPVKVMNYQPILAHHLLLDVPGNPVAATETIIVIDDNSARHHLVPYPFYDIFG